MGLSLSFKNGLEMFIMIYITLGKRKMLQNLNNNDDTHMNI